MTLHTTSETIIAQCTPKGSGALALLRISGADAVIIASKISKLASGKKLIDLPTHTIHYGWVISQENQTVDQVMFFLMHGPRTFTGEHVVEISCHNNPFIIEEIIHQALVHGARLAQPGEFTKRAFLHKKIDLVQAEAINELIHASNQMALKQSLSQLEGSFSSWIQSIEQELVKCLALSEASFEFIDEDMGFGVQIKESIGQLLAGIARSKKAFDKQQHIRQGVRIALIGSVNAGKSSLFNALVGHNRAIVTNIPGTTRDIIEAGVYQHGTYTTLIDTAGLRQTEDIIEAEGIARSLSEAQKADIILLVIDSSRAISQQEHAVYVDLIKRFSSKIIGVYNKSDAYQQDQVSFPFENLPVIKTSSKTGENIKALENVIAEKIDLLFSAMQSPFLLNQRQFTLLLGLEQKLKVINDLFDGFIEYELVSYHLKEALEYSSELSGKTITEQSMDKIFKEFCIGK